VDLQVLWFIIIAIFWIGFFVLEGFDLGVGILHRFVSRNDTEMRVAVNSIGPFWDGNEVWLIVGGAAIFAAFPAWYATWFSALYLALFLVILCLMARGLAFEYRGKVADHRWRSFWTWALTVSSLLLPVLFGVALGDLLVGLPVDKSGEYTGNFFDLLTPYGLWTGVTLLALTVLHGSTFLALKTTGAVAERSRHTATRVAWIAALGVVVFAVWTQVIANNFVIPGPAQILAVFAIFAAVWSVRDGHDGWAFTATAAAIGLTVASIFYNLYPNVLVSSTDSAYNLTVANSASGSYALKVLTIVAVVFFPIVLVYQGYTYWVFRARVRAPHDHDEEPAPVDASSTSGAA
jgi:cytochrome d ubiquinol oxidase subunit II